MRNLKLFLIMLLSVVTTFSGCGKTSDTIPTTSVIESESTYEVESLEAEGNTSHENTSVESTTNESTSNISSENTTSTENITSTENTTVNTESTTNALVNKFWTRILKIYSVTS